ncbi:putative E3 ubiquitin-protein ligase XBAT31 [Andrographis paniculata]|uniref:putative E3 ubiquitin-protein ligase XBAT31 n=1 Tax=Andrographis paniculata TaxID=175694 RepID=UPI0021E91405|nr:putative E3 ubiquitin-protein ligase XBAT31 [Andrographis paniculata]
MGQGLSCRASDEHELLAAIHHGDLETVEEFLQTDSSSTINLHRSAAYDRNSFLHIAAANGKIEILSLLLDKSIKPDSLNRHKQTPLMLAATNGKLSCVEKLIEAGANILMFDSVNGRTCLHYAAYNGHSDCLQVILSAARDSPVANSWGFSRFVNVRDGKGATPLHLAARRSRPECVNVLLNNGALVCATTGRYGFPGSTPLHLAARSGSIDCVRALLAWGADRLQMDNAGRIPYMVALKHHHRECAALLNPSSAEPLIWPSPLKFISELNHDARALLECALMEANKEREKEKVIAKGTVHPLPSSVEYGIDDNASEASDADLCGICFDQTCAIQVEECGHQMCAQCTLVLCCHNKPDPTTASPSVPVCPFCRSNIVKLVVVAKAKPETDKEQEPGFSKPRKSWRGRNSGEGSSSFRGLSAIGSFGRMGRGSGRIVAENEWLDKVQRVA